mmetsp:Transcript_69425/g.165451  ORF Transcript_69425/g.165451 Transcript_69425/m.165451 type:complete len:203 (+) Transcript_69425:170-778(+)
MDVRYRKVCAASDALRRFVDSSCGRPPPSETSQLLFALIARLAGPLSVSKLALTNALTILETFLSSCFRSAIIATWSMALAGPLHRKMPPMNSSNVHSPSPSSKMWNKAAPSCTSTSKVWKYAFTFGFSRMNVSRSSVIRPSPVSSMAWKIPASFSTYSAFFRRPSAIRSSASLCAASSVSLRNTAVMTRIKANTMIVMYNT